MSFQIKNFYARFRLTVVLALLACGLTALAVSTKIVFSEKQENENQPSAAATPPARTKSRTPNKAATTTETKKTKQSPGTAAGESALNSTSGDLVFGQGSGGFGRIIKRNFALPAVETELSGYTNDRDPDWSPDGSKIVYLSGRDRPDNQTFNPEVYIMNADGTNQRRLTFTPPSYRHFAPRFSPDGTKIVYGLYDLSGNTYLIKILNLADLVETSVPGNFSYDAKPDWSSNGNRLILSGGNSIKTINTNGTNETVLLSSSNYISSASYSPNNQKILFAANNNIYVANADGSNQQAVSSTVNGSDDGDPSWSPDGAKIAFVSYRNNLRKIFTVNADGTEETEIVSSEYEF